MFQLRLPDLKKKKLVNYKYSALRFFSLFLLHNTSNIMARRFSISYLSSNVTKQDVFDVLKELPYKVDTGFDGIHKKPKTTSTTALRIKVMHFSHPSLSFDFANTYMLIHIVHVHRAGMIIT